MAKVPADTVKYNIYAKIKIDGVVEKADVVGALFGQSEGLLGEDLELRDLQKSGRIGRIEVDIKPRNGKSKGTILIPSSLDMVETSVIAATIESVDRVGPCNANITVTKVEDARNVKRKKLIKRAKEILKNLMTDEMPESLELTEEVRKAVKLSEIITYKGLPAGPGVPSSDSIIVVEGRADVLNLLRCGIKNAIGVEGTNIPQQIKQLSKKKTVIAFVDGDRGGEMILKELNQTAEVDFVAQAPEDKEVEDLTKKEAILSLRRKMPLDQFEYSYGNKSKKNKKSKKKLLNALDDVKGSLVAKLFDENVEEISEVEIKDLIDTLGHVKPRYVVLDGIITQRLVDAAKDANVESLVGVNTASKLKKKGVDVLTGSS